MVVACVVTPRALISLPVIGLLVLILALVVCAVSSSIGLQNYIGTKGGYILWGTCAAVFDGC